MGGKFRLTDLPAIFLYNVPNPDEPEPKGESRSKRDDTAGR